MSYGLILAVCLVALSAVFKFVGKAGTPTDGPPSDVEQAKDFYQCTRQCQWFYGIRLDISGKLLEGQCKCFNVTTQMPLDKPSVPRFAKKLFDAVQDWGGGYDESGKEYGFNSLLVCTQTAHGTLETMQRSDAEASGADILHCGACASCSSPADIDTLSRTRLWITEVMTQVAADFAAPWGHGNTTLLADNLVEVGFNVSRVRYDGRKDLPSCMDVWIDDITCCAATCKHKCWIKFVYPANSGGSIGGSRMPSMFDFNGQCLRCDEDNCVPYFLKGAGANRRSAGIISDIARPVREQCTVGKFSNTPAEKLPTSPQPSKAFVREVLWRRWS